jgi:hypothetical protein
MVQPAKDRMRNNVSEPLDWARAGSVLPERNVSPREAAKRKNYVSETARFRA